MELSIFIAQILGVFLLVMGVAFLLNLKDYRKLAEDLVKDQMFLMMKKTCAVIIGTVLVVKHNVWNTDWTMIITIVGWASLVGGAFGLLFPRQTMGMAKSLLKQNIILAASVIWIIVGAYLTYVGFFA
jgi:hypothetical protein